MPALVLNNVLSLNDSQSFGPTTCITVIKGDALADPKAVLLLGFFILLCIFVFATADHEEEDDKDLSRKLRILERIERIRLLKRAKETSLEELEKELAFISEIPQQPVHVKRLLKK
ncbi:hypothetical protein C8J56DRAFT_1040071 [Mycena floridula]|nr:hypothetical protein C8J56DRAFT_1040071 [Mycena floridula]